MNTDKIYAEYIAKDYGPKVHSKVAALKKLDAKAKLPASFFGYGVGIFSALVAGTGMSLAMEVMGGTWYWTALGVLIGAIGFAGCAINYPIYKKILEKGKSKYAFEILELAREISEQE